jgi:hypothetical protein
MTLSGGILSVIAILRQLTSEVDQLSDRRMSKETVLRPSIFIVVHLDGLTALFIPTESGSRAVLLTTKRTAAPKQRGLALFIA